MKIVAPRAGIEPATSKNRALSRESGGGNCLTLDALGQAIRCYGKVGFRPVGVMRAYERGADDRWHDGLLMDLLADELL